MGDCVDASTFDFVSQVSHVIGGALVVFATTSLFSDRYLLQIGVVFTLLVAIKEFWYDTNYETAVVRGSNWEDFSFYLMGYALAVLLYYLIKQ